MLPLLFVVELAEQVVVEESEPRQHEFGEVRRLLSTRREEHGRDRIAHAHDRGDLVVESAATVDSVWVVALLMSDLYVNG